ncbi:hypothetical protein [Ruminococcus bromii]|uniref:hypothetical protein n=1 Tax=Ruminococcus bromii TaxID=40518 RepID=UPI00241DAA8D|nr:hypothetical protein [Ruminococcus bromii]
MNKSCGLPLRVPKAFTREDVLTSREGVSKSVESINTVINGKAVGTDAFNVKKD